MQTKFRATMLAIVVLVLGLVAGPAFAQDAPDDFVGPPEGFANQQACEAAIDQVLAGRSGGPGGEAVRNALAEQSEAGLSAERLAELCSIYIPTEPPGGPPEEAEVGGVVIERDPPGDVPEPAQVLGRQLSRTGTDAIVLALFGVSLLGLGVVALRRTRQTDVTDVA